MTLDKTMRATIRAWGLAHHIPGCHARGIIAQSVIDAYWEAHPEQAAAITDAQADPAEPEPESAFTVAVDLYDHEASAQVADQLVNALYATWLAGYEAGKSETRAQLLATLTGDGE